MQGKNIFLSSVSFYLLFNATLLQAGRHFLGKCKPQTLRSAPTCPGFGSRSRTEDREHVLQVELYMRWAPSSTICGTCSTFPLDSITRHNSEKKLLKFQGADCRAIEVSPGTLCDCSGHWPCEAGSSQFPPFLLVAQDSYRVPPSPVSLLSPSPLAADKVACIAQ